MGLREDSGIKACPTWQTQREVFTTLGTPSNDRVVTARHRGDFTDQFAENTLEAFHASYRACRPAIETDVRYTSDDQLVIFHDTHIGKMLEPGYDPRSGLGPNATLDSLTLAQVQAKKVLNVFTRQPMPRENPQWPGVHTVEEMLKDYCTFPGGANALVHLEVKTVVKDGQLDVEKSKRAVVETAKILQAIHVEFPQYEIFKRVILKFQMSLFPAPLYYHAAMQSDGIVEIVMAEPVIAPAGQRQIDSSSETIWDPPDGTYASRTAKAVAWWSLQEALFVPCVEVVIKDSTDFINKRTAAPYLGQRSYVEPYAHEECGALGRCNATVGTMAEMVTIVKTHQKALGVFVPIPDYLMWREDRYVDFGVPNIAAGKNPSIAAEKAYYNNNSQCCYDLDDRIDPSENSDDRMIIGWQRSIGCNVITADDTDSIDYGYYSAGQLELDARPEPVKPPDKMNSVLAWELSYNPRPNPEITLQSPNIDGDMRCLWWIASGDQLSFTYNCDSIFAMKEGGTRQLRTSVRRADGVMRILRGQQCLTATVLDPGGDTTGAHWGVCDDSVGTNWSWDKDSHLINGYNNSLITSPSFIEEWGDSGYRSWGLASTLGFEPGIASRTWTITPRQVPVIPPDPPDPPDPPPEEGGFLRWLWGPLIFINRQVFGRDGNDRGLSG